MAGIERIARAVDVPELRAEVAIVVLERGHRGLGSVGERRQRSSRYQGSAIVRGIRRMRDVTLRAVARRQPPGIGAVAVEVLGICYRIRTIYQSDVAVVLYSDRAGRADQSRNTSNA